MIRIVSKRVRGRSAMTTDRESIHVAIGLRTRYLRHLREKRTADQRLAHLAKLQQASFRALRVAARIPALSPKEPEFAPRGGHRWSVETRFTCSTCSAAIASRLSSSAADRPKDRIDLENLPEDP